MDSVTNTADGLSGVQPLLVLPVLLSVAWGLYELFYASRVLAFLATRLANLFLKDSGIYISELSATRANRSISGYLENVCSDSTLILVYSGCLSMIAWL